jgi:hypothetical protein
MPGKKNGASSNASVKTALSCFIPVPAPWFAIHGLWRIERIPSSHLAMSAGRKKILSAGFALPIGGFSASLRREIPWCDIC